MVQAQQTTSVKIVDNNGRVPEFDPATNNVQIIDQEHHEIHEGGHFFVCGETTLGSGSTVDFQLTTPNTTKWVHMTFSFESTQEVLLEIYEDADVDSDGGAVTAYNNNRNSSNTTSLVLLQTDGTVNTVGTKILAQRSGVAGNVNKARQGVGSRDNELILKQNSTYRFIFTSGGASNNFSYCGEWYEHQNKTI